MRWSITNSSVMSLGLWNPGFAHLRMVAKAKGTPLENPHDPSDMGHLGNADPHDWPKVLLLLQGWGWGGNTVLASNGSNGASHDHSYFDRTLCCTFWRKHRDKTAMEVTGM